MSAEPEEAMEMGTKPVKEHEWLQNLVGEWKVVTEFSMGPDTPKLTSEGTESVTILGGLWAVREGKGPMPDGTPTTTYHVLGYDVSFREYRGCMYASMSSHLWKYAGTLSDDGRTMSLDCEGPSMTEDGKTALYRDVIHLIDADHRTLISSGEDENGEWQEFMKATYTRI